ncbi:MAG: hypothetical protein ACE5K8_09930 [Candidatus Zixiibacteriota bacterium]
MLDFGIVIVIKDKSCTLSLIILIEVLPIHIWRLVDPILPAVIKPLLKRAYGLFEPVECSYHPYVVFYDFHAAPNGYVK